MRIIIAHVFGDMDEKTKKIAEINDLCRSSMGLMCCVDLSPGISKLPKEDQEAIKEKVRTFTDFETDYPAGRERSFGRFDYKGRRVCWLIEYFESGDYALAASKPECVESSQRDLTIMFSEEW